jgi:YVTN family beta-propeller protein
VYVTSEQEGLVVAVDTHSLVPIARMQTGPRPRSIAFATDGTTAFVTSEVGAALAVLDTEKNRPLQPISLAAEGGVPQRPMGAVVSPDGRWLFVSTGRGGSVAVIEVAKKQVARFIRDVGARPWGIAVSRDGKRIYTANGPSDDVSIIDVASGTVQKRVKIGGLPWGLAVR